jgi:uncharacterized phage infection (PIP) family protein YhgE
MPSEELTNDEQDFDAAFEAASEAKTQTPPKKQQEAADEAAGDEAGREADGDASHQASGPEGEQEQRQEAPEEQVARLTRERDEALHKWRSDANRQSFLTRENNQLKEQLGSLKSQVERLQAELTQAKKQAEPKPTKQSPREDGDASDLLENAPELKAAVERRIQMALEEGTREIRAQLDAARAQLAEVSQTAQQAAQYVEPLVSREEQRETEAVRQELDKLFPNWRRDVQEIARWVETQPEQIRAMFPGRGLQDSSTILKLFYADKGVASPPKGTGATSNDRLRAASGIPPRTVTRPTVNKDDFEGAFAEFVAQGKR